MLMITGQDGLPSTFPQQQSVSFTATPKKQENVAWALFCISIFVWISQSLQTAALLGDHI